MTHQSNKGRNYIIRYCLVLMTSIAGVSSSSEDDAQEISCSGISINFAEVQSIVQSSCTSNSDCHGSGSRNGPGALLTYTQIYSARASIKSAVSTGRMPQGSSLSTDERNALICWIENGASNN